MPLNPRCPICSSQLLDFGPNLVCQNHHSYDKSKYGYTNLLKSPIAGQHGDNKEMILGRRDFLNKNYYSFLSESLSNIASKYLSAASSFLDVGCGECYYTEKVLEKTKALGYGIDISKEALQVAHQRTCVKDKKTQLFVASAYELPFFDESFDLVFNVFSPFAREEIYRVLKREGILMVAIPNKKHLFELKEILYKTPYENEVSSFDLEGFSLLEAIPLEQILHLEKGEDIQHLFSMTPYYYRTPKEGKDNLKNYEQLDVTASFLLLIYRKMQA